MSLIPQQSISSSRILIQALRAAVIPSLRNSGFQLAKTGLRQLSTQTLQRALQPAAKKAIIIRPKHALQTSSLNHLVYHRPGQRSFSANAHHRSDEAHIIVKPGSDTSGAQTSIYLNEGKAYVDGKTIALHPRNGTGFRVQDQYQQTSLYEPTARATQRENSSSDPPLLPLLVLLTGGLAAFSGAFTASHWYLAEQGHRHKLAEHEHEKRLTHELQMKKLKVAKEMGINPNVSVY